MTIVHIFTTDTGDLYTAATIDSSATAAAMWRCVVGGSVAWESIADSDGIRHAAAVLGIEPNQVADVASLCAAGDADAIGLRALEADTDDYDTACTLAAVLDGRQLTSDNIIDLLDSIADGSTALV